MIGAVGRMTAFELNGLLRRRWYLITVGLGLAAVAVAAAVASGHDDPAARADSYRASAASLLLVGGLVLALTLGATTIARGGDSGHLGLLVASGARRTAVAAARMLARIGTLLAAYTVWCVALEIASALIGRGADGPLAVHVAASAETHTAVLLAAAAVSTVLGPMVAGIVGLFVYISAQAVVNVEAAADLGRLGAWDRVAHVSYNLLPRAVLSPMIVDMQNRGEGGPAAPRFEINGVVVPLPSAGIGTVLWTLFWCLLLGALCAAGTRRRAL
jgi:hypothetical protein